MPLLSTETKSRIQSMPRESQLLIGPSQIILLDNEMFSPCPQPGRESLFRSLDASVYTSRFSGGKRFLQEPRGCCHCRLDPSAPALLFRR